MNRTIYQLRLERENIEDEIKLVRKKYSDQQKKIVDSEDQVNRL